MKIKYLLLSAAIALGGSGGAAAFTISGGTDVGGVDTFLAEATGLVSGDPFVTEWVSGLVGTSVGISHKSDPASFLITEEDSNVVAFQLFTAPTYFVVKDAEKHVLFQNEPNIDWGVFNLLDYFGENKLGELQLSHLVEFDGTVPVPEPGTLALLGLGLVGFFVLRKKKQK